MGTLPFSPEDISFLNSAKMLCSCHRLSLAKILPWSVPVDPGMQWQMFGVSEKGEPPLKTSTAFPTMLSAVGFTWLSTL